MTFGKKILLVGIASLIFLSALLSIRTSEYILEEKLKTQSISSSDTVLSTPIDGKFKDYALTDSTFVRIYADTEITTNNQALKFENGTVFFTGTIQSNKTLKLNENSTLNLKDFSVFIKKSDEKILITTFEKPVPMFVDSFVFLIPSKSSIQIPATKTSDIKNLTHQHAAKLFTLKSLEAFEAHELGAKNAYKEWQKAFRTVVFETPKIWKKNQVTGLTKFIRETQNKLALFIPESKRAGWFFSEKMTLLSHGMEFLEKHKNTESEKIFEFFRKQLKANESLYFFQSFPEFALEWQNFQNSVAIYSNLNSDKESRSLQHLLNGEIIGFSRLENALASNDLSQVKYTIENMSQFGKNRAKRIRLYWNILQNQPLQIIEAIRLYNTFDTALSTDLEKKEIKDEIITLLKQKNQSHSQEILIITELINTLEVIDYKNIATEKEIEFVSFVQQNQSMGISEAEIENLKEEARIQAELQINTPDDIPEEVIEKEVEKEGAIKNTKMLIEFLQELGIEIIKNKLKSNKETQETSFEGLIGETTLSGKFYYNSQYFENIKTPEKTFSNVFRTEVGYLLEPLQKTKEDPTEVLVDFYEKYREYSEIPQQTTTAILAKNLVVKELSLLGFSSINSNKVIILDQDYSRAQIQNVALKNAQTVQVIYDTTTKEFSNFVGKIGDEVKTKSGSYPFKDISQFLESFQTE